MVRIRDVAWTLAALAVAAAGSRPALASPIAMTGNAATDFGASTGSIKIPVYLDWNVNAGPGPSSPNQLVDGYDIQNIWLNYDKKTDTMTVGFQGYQNVAGKQAIFGNGSGNLNPALDTNSSAANTFLGSKSVAVAFSPLTVNASGKSIPGTPVVMAGIPSDKTMGGSGTIDGFTVSQYSANASGLEFSFGKQLAQYTGNLAFNTSAAHPDLEFTIKNFSKIPGLNMQNGFYLQAYAGAPGDKDGEVQTGWLPAPAPENIQTPEPTTWLAWTLLMAGGAGWRYRRRLAARA